MGRHIAIKKESTFGTYNAPDTVYIDATEEKFAGQNDIQIPEGISRARRRLSPGKWDTSTGGFGIPADARVVGVPLYGMLGAAVVEADLPATGEYLHTFWPTDDIPSYSVAIGYDDFITKKVTGAVINQCTFSVAAGEVAKIDLDMPFASYSIADGASDPTYWGLSSSLNDDILLGFHEAELYLSSEGNGFGASRRNRKPASWELVINNNVNMPNVLGQRGVYAKQEQKREISGSLEIVFEDGTTFDAEDELEYVLGAASATEPQDSLTEASVVLDLTSATSVVTSSHQLIFYAPRAIYRAGDPNLNGAGAIMQTVEFDAFLSTSAPATDPWESVAALSAPTGAPTNYDLVAVLVNDVPSAYSSF